MQVRDAMSKEVLVVGPEHTVRRMLSQCGYRYRLHVSGPVSYTHLTLPTIYSV